MLPYVAIMLVMQSARHEHAPARDVTFLVQVGSDQFKLWAQMRSPESGNTLPSTPYKVPGKESLVSHSSCLEVESWADDSASVIGKGLASRLSCRAGPVAEAQGRPKPTSKGKSPKSSPYAQAPGLGSGRIAHPPGSRPTTKSTSTAPSAGHNARATRPGAQTPAAGSAPGKPRKNAAGVSSKLDARREDSDRHSVQSRQSIDFAGSTDPATWQNAGPLTYNELMREESAHDTHEQDMDAEVRNWCAVWACACVQTLCEACRGLTPAKHGAGQQPCASTLWYP
jgi:hypothetical protein